MPDLPNFQQLLPIGMLNTARGAVAVAVACLADPSVLTTTWESEGKRRFRGALWLEEVKSTN